MALSEEQLKKLAKTIRLLWIKAPEDFVEKRLTGNVLAVMYNTWEDAACTIGLLERRVVFHGKQLKQLVKNTSRVPPKLIQEMVGHNIATLQEGEGIILVAIRGTDGMIVWDCEGFRCTSLVDSIVQELHDLTAGHLPGSSADVWKATMLARYSEGHPTTADLYKRCTTTCASCGVTKASLQQCSNCGMCHYCGKDCQRRD
jgi:hypothetical protein